jgi:hypothetical protein
VRVTFKNGLRPKPFNHGVFIKDTFKNGLRPKPFNHGVFIKDATPPQLDFLSMELPRFEACGAWEHAYNTRNVYRMFLVPKTGVNKRRLIIDLRELNRYCAEFSMSCETLKHLRHLSRPGDYFVLLDQADGNTRSASEGKTATSSQLTEGANSGALRACRWVGPGPPTTFASQRRRSPTTSGVQLRPRSQGRRHPTSPREDSCATSVGAGFDFYTTWTTSC